MNIIILSPLYNDWKSLEKLIVEIGKVIKDNKYNAKLIVLNDGSTEKKDNYKLTSDNLEVKILDLTNNIGHQRAIAIGLSYINDNYKDIDYVLVMDSDGEDNPIYISSLINKAKEGKKIIFGQRVKRNESILFLFLYYMYKFIFKFLTGKVINFGNFSCIPNNYVLNLISMPDLWNHFPGTVIKSKLPYDTLASKRNKRYYDNSKMNTNSLILHGLSSISLYLDLVTIKMLKLMGGLLFLSITFILFIFYLKFYSNYTIPFLATTLSISIFNIFIIIFFFAFLIILLQLQSRNIRQQSPKEFYKLFILNY